MTRSTSARRQGNNLMVRCSCGAAEFPLPLAGGQHTCVCGTPYVYTEGQLTSALAPSLPQTDYPGPGVGNPNLKPAPRRPDPRRSQPL